MQDRGASLSREARVASKRADEAEAQLAGRAWGLSGSKLQDNIEFQRVMSMYSVNN